MLAVNPRLFTKIEKTDKFDTMSDKEGLKCC